MSTVLLVLVGSSAIWMLALRGQGVSANRKFMEFWWAAAVFFTGGIGTLASFSFLTLSPEQSTLVRTLPIGAIGALLLVRTFTARTPHIPGHTFFLAILFGILLTYIASGNQILMTMVSLMIFVPALIVPRDGYRLDALKAGAAFGVGLMSLTLVLLAFTSTTELFGMCRLDKCSLWGLSLGELGRGNALGMFLAAAAGVTMLAASTFLRTLVIMGSSYLMVDLTSSRSALYGWVIAVAAVLAYKLTIKTRRKLFIGLGALATTAVVAVFPYLGWSPADFTGRATLWQYAAQLYDRSPLFGYGASFWVSNAGSDSIDRNYSTHSLLPELLVSAGIVGTIAFAIALLIAARGRKLFDTSAYTCAIIMITVGLSITEVFSAPGRVYLVSGIIVYLFVVSQSVSGNTYLEAPRHKRRAHFAPHDAYSRFREEPRTPAALQLH